MNTSGLLESPRPLAYRFSDALVDVFYLDTSVFHDDISDLRDFLSQEETSRAARYYFERDRRRFVIARAFLKSLLSKRFDTEARGIELSLSSTGKPFWKHAPGAFSFNMSHSHNLIAVAICETREVGIDIEFCDLDFPFSHLISSVLSPAEQNIYQALRPELQRDFFYSIWVQKEALGKADGQGLGIDFPNITVAIDFDNSRPNPSLVGDFELHLCTVEKTYRQGLALIRMTR